MKIEGLKGKVTNFDLNQSAKKRLIRNGYAESELWGAKVYMHKERATAIGDEKTIRRMLKTMIDLKFERRSFGKIMTKKETMIIKDSEIEPNEFTFDTKMVKRTWITVGNPRFVQLVTVSSEGCRRQGLLMVGGDLFGIVTGRNKKDIEEENDED